jgi:hypothetical protein
MPQVTAPCAGDTVVRGQVTASPRNVFVHSMPVTGPGPSSTVAISGTAMTATFAKAIPLGRVEVSLFSQTAEAYIWSQGVVQVRDCSLHGNVTSGADLVVAGGTQDNDLTVSVDELTGRYRVSDLSGELRASTGCTAETPRIVTCLAPTSGRVVVQAGAGADEVVLDPSVLPAGTARHVLAGGDGADVLTGGAGDEALDGGGSADVLDGGPGDDVVEARDGGSDTIDCGAGVGDEVDQDSADAQVGCEAVRIAAPPVAVQPPAETVLTVPVPSEPAADMQPAPRPPATPPAPTGFSTPAPNLSVTLPAAGASVARHRVPVTLTNENPFAVRVTVELSVPGARRVRRPTSLGRATTSLAPGRRASVAVPLSTRGRRLVGRRVVKATLTVTLRDPTGTLRTISRRITLRPKRRG